jgi:hypothetical protein
LRPDPVFINVTGAQESIPRNVPSASQLPCTVKKITEFLYLFYKTFQKRQNAYADKGFFGALQRRNFLSFEEGKVFLFLEG